MKRNMITQLLFAIMICTITTLDINAQAVIKGTRVPQLTTEQRNTISDIDLVNAKGQLIYNMDNNCLEYWDGEKWVSLCQGSTDPVVSIPETACGKIRVYGKYYKNVPLSNTHYLILPVTVTEKGSYTIVASSNNGYYFQTSGTFEDVGNYELRLEAMGTPTHDETNSLTISCNGGQIVTVCDVSVNVGALTMGYKAYCEDIEVFGSYQTRQSMTTDNYVKVPIEVHVDGNTKWETDLVNGVKFSCNQTLSSYGADTLIVKAQGIPIKSGKYKFTFTTDGSVKNTCTFEVNFFSLLGTFAEPACRCLDIYGERPDVVNGEYWLVDCEVPEGGPVKTFCDIENGGWTLMWSYSEKTSLNTYQPVGNMSVDGSIYGAFFDVPRNRVTTETGVINYADYRLSRAEWQHFSNSMSRPQLKVRIAEDPTNMEDEWALNNYAVISPRNVDDNPIESRYGARGNIPTQGKVFGKNWEVKAVGGGAYGGWDEISGNRLIAPYSNNNYCTHWDFGNAGSSTLFEVAPNKNTSGEDNTIAFNNMNNMFGWFGENQPNHHFGKCGGNTGSDYGFSTKTCGSGTLAPHSFNGGEGRYIQWFVK